MGIPDHLTCLLKNLYAGQEATVRTGHEKQTGSKSGKEYIRLSIVTCLFNLYAEYIMQNAGLDEAQAGIKIAGQRRDGVKVKTTASCGYDWEKYQ